jgi:hypothetical protein
MHWKLLHDFHIFHYTDEGKKLFVPETHFGQTRNFVREIEVVYVRFSYVCHLTRPVVTVLLFTQSQRISIFHRFSVESLSVSLLIGG